MVEKTGYLMIYNLLTFFLYNAKIIRQNIMQILVN